MVQAAVPVFPSCRTSHARLVSSVLPRHSVSALCRDKCSTAGSNGVKVDLGLSNIRYNVLKVELVRIQNKMCCFCCRLFRSIMPDLGTYQLVSKNKMALAILAP